MSYPHARAPLREHLQRERRDIEAASLFFAGNAADLPLAQLVRLNALAAGMRGLSNTARGLDLTPRVVVKGYADASATGP